MCFKSSQIANILHGVDVYSRGGGLEVQNMVTNSNLEICLVIHKRKKYISIFLYIGKRNVLASDSSQHKYISWKIV